MSTHCPEQHCWPIGQLSLHNPQLLLSIRETQRKISVCVGIEQHSAPTGQGSLHSAQMPVYPPRPEIQTLTGGPGRIFGQQVCPPIHKKFGLHSTISFL